MSTTDSHQSLIEIANANSAEQKSKFLAVGNIPVSKPEVVFVQLNIPASEKQASNENKIVEPNIDTHPIGDNTVYGIDFGRDQPSDFVVRTNDPNIPVIIKGSKPVDQQSWESGNCILNTDLKLTNISQINCLKKELPDLFQSFLPMVDDNVEVNLMLNEFKNVDSRYNILFVRTLKIDNNERNMSGAYFYIERIKNEQST